MHLLNSRLRPSVALLGVLFSSLLLGCGSGGSSGPSPFLGNWSGHWNTTINPTQQQTVTLTIDAAGNATGEVHSQGPLPNTTVLFGTVSSSGTMDLSIRSGINPPRVLPKAQGQMYLSSAQAAFGSLVVTENGTPIYTVAIDLTKM